MSDESARLCNTVNRNIESDDETSYIPKETAQDLQTPLQLPNDVVFSVRSSSIDDAYTELMRYLRDIYRCNQCLPSLPLILPCSICIDVIDRIHFNNIHRWKMSSSWCAESGEACLIRRCGSVQTLVKVILFRRLRAWNPSAHVAFHMQIPLSRSADNKVIRDQKARVVCVRECNVAYWRIKPKSDLILHPLSNNGVPIPDLWIETFFCNDRRDQYRALDRKAFIRFECCHEIEYLAIGLTDTLPMIYGREDDDVEEFIPNITTKPVCRGPFLLHWRPGTVHPDFYRVTRNDQYLQTVAGYSLPFSLLINPRVYAAEI